MALKFVIIRVIWRERAQDFTIPLPFLSNSNVFSLFSQ